MEGVKLRIVTGVQDPGGKRKRYLPQIRGNRRAMKIKDSCKEK